jgi:acyl-CoA thioesterase YciA
MALDHGARPWRSTMALALGGGRGHPRPMSDLFEEPVIRTVAMPRDTNPAGDIFGGWLMSQMDLAAGIVAARRARGRCATIAIAAMKFERPVHIGDEVSLYGRLTETGTTSMRIHVEAWRRPPPAGPRTTASRFPARTRCPGRTGPD